MVLYCARLVKARQGTLPFVTDRSSTNLAARLEDLESRFAFQEELVRQLDDVIRAQADQIDKLEDEVLKIRTEMTHSTEEEAPMEEQVPPHY
ncbi:MAG: SlyX family protein [Myxococcota bacterium]|jgi:uncharacterized coiled-coil protein SlyX|nr:SlyX family protein [Myxococcota bacterium]